jgi:elongator complex protein 4
MSFRKRNIGLSAGVDRAAVPNTPAQPAPESNPGIRPSPDDGRPTTSTGTPSLDNLLAGHGGLPMGKSLLIEENGTTDFAGALLRYYAAEGVVQDQKVHVVGVPEQWGRSLPGLIGTAESLNDKRPDKRKDEKMKIAWRYERLGEFGAGIAGSRDGESSLKHSLSFICTDNSSSCSRCSWRTRWEAAICLLPRLRSH